MPTSFDARLRAWALIQLLLGHLLSGTVAFAAPPPDEARARVEARRARAAFERSSFEEALDAYANAYALDPRPPTLFNIGQCHRRLGNHERAAFFFRRYLASYPEGAAPNGRQVEGLIAEMDEAAERQAKQAAGAQAAVEGEQGDERLPEEKEDAPVASSPTHRLEPAPAPQMPVASRSALEGIDSSSTGALKEPGARPRSSIFMKWWFWTGVGVVAAAAGTTAYVLSTPRSRETTLGTQSLR